MRFVVCLKLATFASVLAVAIEPFPLALGLLVAMPAAWWYGRVLRETERLRDEELQRRQYEAELEALVEAEREE